MALALGCPSMLACCRQGKATYRCDTKPMLMARGGMSWRCQNLFVFPLALISALKALAELPPDE